MLLVNTPKRWPKCLIVPLILWLISSLHIANAQQSSIVLSSGTSAAGASNISLNISLTNSSGAAPAGLQWTVGYPAADIGGVSFNAGADATAVNKEPDCFDNGNGTATCVLYGSDDSPISNGVVARATFTLKSGIAAGALPITLTGAYAVDGSGDSVSATATGGTITIPAVPPALSGLTCTSPTLAGPASDSCTVSLTSAAPSGGFKVNLSSNNSTVTVPASVSVAQNATSAGFTATANSVTSTQSVTLTASANSVSKTYTLQVTPDPTAALAGMSCNSTSVTGPGSDYCTVSLTSAAPSGGFKVNLSSNNSAVTVPASVTVAQNTTSAGFTATANSVTSTQSVTLTASANSVSKTFGITVKPSSGTATGITRDVNVSQDQNTASSTVSSPAFSTANSNELLLAFISTDSLGSPNTTVQSVSGAGLTWVLVVRTNVQGGTSEIWRAFAPAVLKNVSVTATLSQTVVSSMTVMTFSGVAATGTYGSGAIGAIGSGYASSGAPTATLKTTHNNSLVVGVGNDFDNAIPRVPVAGQSLVHQRLSSTQDTYWVQILNGPTLSSGTSVTVSDTAPSSDQYNLSICEILAAGGN